MLNGLVAERIFIVKYYYRISVVSLVLCLLLGCEQQDVPRSEFDLVEQAKEYIEKDNSQSAIITLKNVLKQSPGNAEARWLLGQQYVASGNYPYAVKELRKAESLGIRHEDVALDLGQALLKTDAPADALLELPQNTGRNDDERYRTAIVRGDAFRDLGRNQPALESYALAMELRPDSSEVKVRIAELRLVEQGLAAAEAAVEQGLKAIPEDSELLKLNAKLLRERGKYHAAELVDRQVLENAPEDPVAKMGLAWSLYAQGDLGRAREIAEEAIAQGMSNPELLLLRGAIAYEDKDYARARVYLEPIVGLKPSDFRAALLLAAVGYSQQRYEEALNLVRKVLNGEPNNEAARILATALYAAKGEDDNAEEVIADTSKISSAHASVVAKVGGDIAAEVSHAQSNDRAISMIAGQPIGPASIAVVEAYRAIADSDDEAYRDVLQQNAERLRSGDFANAEEAIASSLEAWPRDSVLLNLLAMAKINRGLEAQALEIWNRVLAGSPADPAANVSLAAVDLKAGRVDSARRRYEVVLEQHPDDLYTLVIAAAFARNDGRDGDAKEYLERAMSAHPDAWQPRERLADLALKQGDGRRAEALMEPMLLRWARLPPVYIAMGRAQFKNGDMEGAQESFSRLTKLAPNFALGWFLLAQSQLGSSDVDGMITSLERVLQLEPDHIRARLALANAYMEQGEVEKVRALTSRLPEGAAALSDFQLVAAWLALQDKRDEDALAIYQGILEKTPRTAVVLDIALLQRRMQRPTEALETMQKWVAEHPNDKSVWAALASSYLSMGMADKARVSFEKVLELDPNNRVANNNLVFLLSKSDPDRALAMARRNVERSPEDANSLDTLGVQLIQRGDHVEGLEVLLQALKAETRDPTVGYHLAVALDLNKNFEDAYKLVASIVKSEVAFPERDDAQALYKRLQVQLDLEGAGQ